MFYKKNQNIYLGLRSFTFFLVLLFIALGITRCTSQKATFSCPGGGAPMEQIFNPGEEAKIIAAVNSLSADCNKITFKAGQYNFSNTINTGDKKNIYIDGAGSGKDETVLNFTPDVQDGIYATGDNFFVSNLAVTNPAKNGIKVENATDVVFQNVRAEWDNNNLSSNGAYGLYPVKCENVIIEDSEAYAASDAGIYVGQVTNTIVRRNIAKRNVAGIEIENTQYADVYDNEATDNTSGLLVFDLPSNNHMLGTDISVHDNKVYSNNRVNFAPGGTVDKLPSGTGTVIIASRRVELFDNEYYDNSTADIGVVTGLLIDDDIEKWGGKKENYQIKDIYIHDNILSGDTTGINPDYAKDVGQLMTVVYDAMRAKGSHSISKIVYAVEDVFPDLNTYNFCVKDNSNQSLIQVDAINLENLVKAIVDARKGVEDNGTDQTLKTTLAELEEKTYKKILNRLTKQYTKDFGKYDCNGFEKALKLPSF